MAKITVTASSDFFDRANNIQRVVGQTFEIKEEFVKNYAGTIEKETAAKKATTKKAKKTSK